MFTNLILDTDRMFTMQFEKKELTGASHALKKKCEEAKKKLIEADNNLSYAKKNEFMSPAGWYECDLAKRALTKREHELQSLYNQLRNQLRKDKEKLNKK